MTWAELLRTRPTLAVGQASDLKFDEGGVRIWLSRCGLDGEPYANTVTVEAFNARDGCWEDLAVLDGDVECNNHPAVWLGSGL